MSVNTFVLEALSCRHRRLSTRCWCVLASRSRIRTITYRCWSRHGATASTVGPEAPTASPASVPRLELRGISKRYADVIANEDVDLKVGAGEIHALLGEN